jgi:hypothetical protein
MPTEHPHKRLGKLHGPSRGAYTGGIYDKHEIKEFVGTAKYGALYPFEMASATRYQGRKAPVRQTTGTDQIGG